MYEAPRAIQLAASGHPTGSRARAEPPEVDPPGLTHAGEPRETTHGRIAFTAGTMATAIGALAMAGWWLGIDGLTRWIPGLPVMVPMTAVAGMLLGAALTLAARAGASRSTAVAALSAAALVLAVATLVAWLLDSAVGPERLFLYGTAASSLAHPGRASPPTAVALACLAAALLLTAGRSSRRLLVQLLNLTAGALAVGAIAGHLHGVALLFGVSRVIGVSLPTALALLAMAAGGIALQPGYGLWALLAAPGPIGHHARQLFAAALAVPFGGAVLLRVGEGLGLYDARFRSASYLSLTALLLCGVAWAGVTSLRRTQDERDKAAAERAARELAEAVASGLRDESRRKSTFIAMLSHELRNPLAAVRNALWLLEHGTPGTETAVLARNVLGRQVGHLSRMLDDLLDVTRLAERKIHLERARVDLVQIVRHVIDDHERQLAERHLALERELPPAPVWVDADATRITQALANLLQNAAKFTEPGGRVGVRLSVEADTAAVRIDDTGVGIEPAMLTRIFEPFTQADDSLHRTGGGIGVGLSLVKGIVDLHAGSVEARSAGRGRGSEFVVRLPVVSAPVSEPRRRPRAVVRPLKILVVEDNPDAADTLRDVLAMRGHDVRVADDGRAGFAETRAFGPDVVFCDIGLPEMSGYDVARAIRADAATAATFLVAMTGYARREDQRLAAEAGFDRHLAKPATLEDIEEILAGVSAGAKPQAARG